MRGFQFKRLPAHKVALSADDFILIAVLWILAARAALASVYAAYIGNTAMSARAYDNRLQTEALITAALPKFWRPRLSNGRLGDWRGIPFRGARIDLNLAPKPFLSGLLAALGAKPSDADSYADNIIAWRTKPPPGGQNQEADPYKDAGLNYRPRRALFQSAPDLRLVRGLPGALVDAALPFVTVYNGKAEIDIKTRPRPKSSRPCRI